MALYHSCLIDGDGHVGPREELNAESDREAMDNAKKYLVRHPEIPGVEVWLGDRLIVKLRQSIR